MLRPRLCLWLVAVIVGATSTAVARRTAPLPAAPLTMDELLAATAADDWRPLDPENTVYVELASGRVVIELAPAFAPEHVANIRLLAREHYYDGIAIIRSQDNYVVQWGDLDGTRPLQTAAKAITAEFSRPAKGLPFASLPDRDVYASTVGFVSGFAAARDTDDDAGQAWLAHCYGAVGVGRDENADSGSGTDLYVVIGHAPRHLDRNITLVGRVLKGMELLSVLPRGSGPLGFYQPTEATTPIRSIRVAADLPLSERTPLEVLRTDTETFSLLVETRRHRAGPWFKFSPERVELCNVPVPVRTPPRP